METEGQIGKQPETPEKRFTGLKERIISSMIKRGGNPKAKNLRSGYETAEIAKREIKSGRTNSLCLDINGSWREGFTEEVQQFAKAVEWSMPIDNCSLNTIVGIFATLMDPKAADLFSKGLSETDFGRGFDLKVELEDYLDQNKDRFSQSFVNHLESFAANLENPESA